jgi:hypothetical protein
MAVRQREGDPYTVGDAEPTRDAEAQLLGELLPDVEREKKGKMEGVMVGVYARVSMSVL